MPTVGFTGDFCTMHRLEDKVNQGIWQPYFSDIKSFFAANDFNILDLEAPLTNQTQGILKSGPVIKMPMLSTAILNYLHCELVATANNHFMDYGVNGLLDTYHALRKENIDVVGSGINSKDAGEFKLLHKEDTKIAIINCTENEWSTTHGSEAGCNPAEPVIIYKQIQKAKKVADFVVVVLHGGHEHYPLPTIRMKELYRFFIDVGANAVIGHHPHIVSGYEEYKDCPIFYSLGNFCFDWPGKRNSEWNYGLIVQLTFKKGEKVSYFYKHIIQNDAEIGVQILKGDAIAKREARLNELNGIIQNDVELEKAFAQYVADKKAIIRTQLEPYSGRILPSLFKRGFLPSFISKRKLAWLTNIIRAESHREMLLEGLKKK